MSSRKRSSASGPASEKENEPTKRTPKFVLLPGENGWQRNRAEAEKRVNDWIKEPDGSSSVNTLWQKLRDDKLAMPYTTLCDFIKRARIAQSAPTEELEDAAASSTGAAAKSQHGNAHKVAGLAQRCQDLENELRAVKQVLANVRHENSLLDKEVHLLHSMIESHDAARDIDGIGEAIEKLPPVGDPLHATAQSTLLTSLRDKTLEQLNVRDGNGARPLHAAAKGNHAAVVKFLLARGVDVNPRLKETLETPLSLFFQHGGRREYEVFRLLFAHDAIVHCHPPVDGRD